MSDDEIISRAMDIVRERLAGGVLMRSFGDLVSHAAMRLRDERREVMLAYWLTKDMRLLSVEEVAIGSDVQISLSVIDIARRALLAGAGAAAFVHNHPSGEPDASDADRICAEKINRTLANIGIWPAGHFTVGRDEAENILTGDRAQLVSVDRTDAPRCPRCDSLLSEGEHHVPN